MEIKKLNLHEAYSLYILLKPVFPETEDDKSLLDFLHDLIYRISKHNPSILKKMFNLFSKEKEVKIDWGNQSEVLSHMIKAFEINEIRRLMSFFDGFIDA